MSNHPTGKSSGGASGSVFVIGLFALVALIFLGVFYGSRPRNPDAAPPVDSKVLAQEAFLDAMNSGKNFLAQGTQGAPKAIEYFSEALAINSGDADAALNLSNAHLLNNDPEAAGEAATTALGINRQDPAGHYLLGCSLLRAGDFEAALKSLQTAKDLDHTINAVSFQLGRAHQGLGQWQEASEQFREVAQFDPEHGAVFYNLSQVLIRLGDEAGAEQALSQHQAIAEKMGAMITDPSVFETCVYTEARVPFKLDQPEPEGIEVSFADATREILGDLAETLVGPVGVMDVGHDGQLDLFARHREEGFQLVLKREGQFTLEGFPYPALEGANYTACLVGDLQHKSSMMSGRQEDVLLTSDQGTQVFRVSPDGMLSDSSLFAQIADWRLENAVLTDLDLTGKLDIVGLNPTNRSLVFLRNQGNLSFLNQTTTTNLPSQVENVREFVFNDWDGDDLQDLFLSRPDQATVLYLRQRGGGFVESETFSQLPPADKFLVGDLNNDLRADLVSLGGGVLTIQFQGEEAATPVADNVNALSGLSLVDYDNDGWLDILGIQGGQLRAWRNRGLEGMLETSDQLNMPTSSAGEIVKLHVADLDGDCDSDLLLTLSDQSLKVLRNDGGNKNQQLKLRLEGNRSNPSALGVKVEITSGGLRLVRTVNELPLEIGLGSRTRVDAIDPHWSDLVTTTDFELEDCSELAIPELELPTGSCPYLYVWNGEKYQFVTDLLGAAPLGLPVAAGKLIPADTDEVVWIGGADRFQPKDGVYEVQITEELREVLYLDEAKLVVVDRPADIEVYPTSKLVSRPPFPEAGVVALKRVASLQQALRSDGLDVTKALNEIDEKMASPVALRAPQLRGLAESYHLDLDFGAIDVTRPLFLAMNGWLRFGGGMANMGASHDPDLPFPFPVLSAEGLDGEWSLVEIEVGAPAGKTKAMVVDLEGKLPAGTKRLRLTMAFEIHWDRIVLMEKADPSLMQQQTFAAGRSDLHWRGFSEYQDLPWTLPLSPDYDKVTDRAPWLITPSGWCTRYGDVGELLTEKDNRLVIMNGGDELTLSFPSDQIPAPATGAQRDFFLLTSGWDKDADPHVVQGWTVDPIPWHGMDVQRYGEEARPAELGTEWMEAYNTRWVGQFTLRRAASVRSE